MKGVNFLKPFAMLLAFAAAFALTSATYPFKDYFDHWEKLGERKINYGLDRDEIYVQAREGVFTALKFKVKRSGINMHKMVVHFENGGTQEIELRANMAQGSESRVIDLNGGGRFIEKVVFWYDTKNYRARKGVIELWGRH